MYDSTKELKEKVTLNLGGQNLLVNQDSPQPVTRQTKVYSVICGL